MGIIVNIPDGGVLWGPIRAMRNEFVISVGEVRRFLAPAFGKGAKFVDGYLDTKDDGEG